MNIRLSRSRTLVAALATLSLAAAAVPNWGKLRLDVEPGVGTSGLKLNEIVPKEWPKQLGAPNIDFRFHDTGEGFRHLFWGQTKAGQLAKGIEVRTLGSTPETAMELGALARLNQLVSERLV